MYTLKLKQTEKKKEENGVACLSYPNLNVGSFKYNKKLLKLFTMYTGLKLNKPLSKLTAGDLSLILNNHKAKLYSDNIPVISAFCKSVIENISDTSLVKNIDNRRLSEEYIFYQEDLSKCQIVTKNTNNSIRDIINDPLANETIDKYKSFVFIEFFILKYLKKRNTLNPFNFGLFKYFVVLYYATYLKNQYRKRTQQVVPSKIIENSMDAIWQKNEVNMNYIVFPITKEIDRKYLSSLSLEILYNNIETFSNFILTTLK